MNGYKEAYRYFCVSENKWISNVEKDEGSPPNVCVNDASHVIKPESVVVSSRYAKVSKILGLDEFNEVDMQNVNIENVADKTTLLAKRVRILETLLSRLNVLKFT